MPSQESATPVLALAGALLLALGCTSTAAPPPPEPLPGEREPYVIGATDQLTISVWRQPELTTTAPVRPDGMISVPLIDDVQAEGLTPEELKEVITAELSEYISAPDVTVVVSQMNSRTVAVIGEVGRSGLIPLQRNTRVLDAIATMGGFSPFASKDDVKILRKTEGGVVEYEFDYEAYIDGDAPESNLLLRPGDTIVVSD